MPRKKKNITDGCNTNKEVVAKLKSFKEKEAEVLAKGVGTEDILNLDPQLQRLIHLWMTGKYSIAKLSEIMGRSSTWISNQLKRPDVKAVVNAMGAQRHEMVSLQMQALTLKAAERLNSLIDSPMDAVALNAVKDVLDRAGHKSKQEIKIDKTVTTIEEKMKNLIDNTITDDVLEAEFEEVEDSDN